MQTGISLKVTKRSETYTIHVRFVQTASTLFRIRIRIHPWWSRGSVISEQIEVTAAQMRYSQPKCRILDLLWTDTEARKRYYVVENAVFIPVDCKNIFQLEAANWESYSKWFSWDGSRLWKNGLSNATLFHVLQIVSFHNCGSVTTLL